MLNPPFVIVAPAFHPINAGYANAIKNFVRALSKGTERAILVVTSCALGDAEEVDWPNVTVKRIHLRPSVPIAPKSLLGKLTGLSLRILNDIVCGLELRKMLKGGRLYFCLFETFEHPMALLATTVGIEARLRRKLAVRIHGAMETEVIFSRNHLWDIVHRTIVRIVAKRIPNIAVTTSHYFDVFKRNFLDMNEMLTEKNYISIPNIAIAYDAERDARRQEELTLFTLGRMNRQGMNQKNFELIAQAVFLLKKSHEALYANLKVTIVGDGESRETFEGLLESLHIRRKFTLYRSLDNEEVRRLQSSSSAVVLASRYEGQSMFALEALGAGAPLIVSSGTGVSSLVEDGKNGFHIDPDDPYSLVEAICRLAESNIEGFRTSSRQKFCERFDEDKTIRRFTLYAEMCQATLRS